MFIAVLASAFAFRGALEYRPTSSGWRKRANELDARLSHMYAVLGSYRGLILVWEDDVPDTDTWGNPRIYGSPAAMASMQSFVEMGRPRDVPIRILDGLADLDSISEKGQPATLRANLARLRRNGKAFTVSIVLSEGNVIEANGRVAGRRVVLWLADTPIRGEDGRVAIDRFETGKLVLQDDPVASAEVLGRAPFPIWRVSGQGQLLWVNDSYAKAVGVETVTDVLEQQIYLDEQSARDMRDVLISKNRQETVRNLILNGELTATRILQFAISGGVVGMALDASELENLRQALNHHIRAHNEILNNMDEAVVTFGRGQTMRFHNRAFASLFHLEESWFKGQPTHGEWLDHLRETGRLPPVSDYRDWRQAELDLYTSWPDEVPPEIWTLPDGATLRLVRMRDPNGGISLLLSDITNTVTLQSQFNTLIKVHTATLDKLTEGIAVFGADGHLKIYNSAFASIWEIPEDSLSDNPSFSDLSRRCLPLYHDRHFWNEIKARITDPNPDVRRQVNGEIKRSDDSILTWLSRPLPDGATLVAWNDVTSARKAEEALIERAEAVETADRLKSEFVNHVSYQLRTPLTTISGYADFLQTNGAGALNDKQAEYIFAIRTASEDLRKTIEDILDIAAIEANVFDLELGDVNVFDLLSQALGYVATKAEDTGKQIGLDCPEDIGIIRADARRLKQVVYNLLSNALRFTGLGGEIDLGARPSGGCGVMIWVKDNGIGIPSERQPQVFESFHSSRGGVGLGLALVQRVVERHGGWVELESEEGQGTHVTVYLPREAPADHALPELRFR